MPAKMTIKKVQAVMKRLEGNISALTRREARLGKAISFGAFVVINPNVNKQRLPAPFSGGN